MADLLASRLAQMKAVRSLRLSLARAVAYATLLRARSGLRLSRARAVAQCSGLCLSLSLSLAVVYAALCSEVEKIDKPTHGWVDECDGGDWQVMAPDSDSSRSDSDGGWSSDD